MANLPPRQNFPTELSYMNFLEQCLRDVGEYEWLKTPGRDLGELEQEVLRVWDLQGPDFVPPAARPPGRGMVK